MSVKAPNLSMRRRIQFISFVMVFVITGVLIARLAYLNLINYEEYKKKASQQQFKVTSIAPNRGTIYDSLGNELAKSATVWTVYLVPVNIKSDEAAKTIAQGLSEILGVDYDKIYEKAKKEKSYYQIVKKRIEDEDADRVRQFILDEKIKGGISLEEDTKRYYPYGKLASTVLGFVGEDNTGLSGIESYYNKILSGTPGRIVSAKNAWGSDMPYKYEQMFEAKNGNSLVLTINSVIQMFVEKHLETAVKEHDVRNRAFCIVMEIKTGRVLAMSTKGDYDPNEPFVIYDPNAQKRLDELEKGSDEYYAQLKIEQELQWRNKAVSDPYEPGSVFKIITASSALEENVVTANSTFTCNGYINVAGNNIKCWRYPRNHGTQTLAQTLQNSCNPAFIMIGQKLGGALFYKYFDNFGLNKKTGIDIPGEADNSGLVHSLHSLTELGSESLSYLSSSAFGQTFKVTPIQLITAISGILNGGNLMKPYIVEQQLDSDGNIVEVTSPQVVRQVVSEDTSKQMANFLEQVVELGSGRYAKVKGYRIGGKTGTSEKLDSGDKSARISSFLGFAPADDPQVAVLLALDEPHSDSVYGSVIASPVVGNILADILPYLGIEPQYSEDELSSMEMSVPYLLGENPYEASNTLKSQGFAVKTIGEGEKVVKQVPGAGEPLIKGGTVVLYTDASATEETVTVPNVIGLSGQQASKALTNKNLNIRISGIDISQGNTKAVSQSIEAGEKVAPGTVITVEFVTTDELH